MSFSRTSRPAAFVLLSLVLAGTIAGCKDDLPPPTGAEVQIRFRGEPQSLTTGARVWIDGAPAIDSLTVSSMRLVLTEGAHSIVVRKDCVTVEPAETVSVRIEPGVPASVDFLLRASSGLLAVRSDPAGLPVWLDGAPTGLTTPASFPCIEPGTHEIVIPSSALAQVGFRVEGDTARTVTVGSEGETRADFQFAYEPVAQERGVLMELFTATFCPNCPVSDEAAESLEHDPGFMPDRLSVVQVHLWWGGTDPLYTAEIGERVNFYGNDQSAPYVFFNGLDKVSGSAYPDVRELYRNKILATYGTAAKAALYWTDVRAEDGQARGRIRFVAIEDLSGFEKPELHAFFVRDTMTISEPQYNPFHLPMTQGARDYIEPIDLAAAGKVVAGSFLDLDVAFDVAADVLPSYLLWDSRALRLVAFVQDKATKQILQCREVRLRLP